MDLVDAVRSRRSIRKYQDRQVPWDEIVKILHSAKYAPFAGNIMNSKFIVIKDEDKRNAIADACADQHWMALAPVHIVVVGEPEKAERYYGARGARLYTIQGGAAAIQNMLLTAHAIGLGACWVGSFDEELIREVCGLPEHVFVEAVVTIGYADEKPDMPPKYRIEHMMFFNKWWGRIEGPKTGLGMWSPSIEKIVKTGSKSAKKGSKKVVEKIRGKLKKKKA
tara:strand:- start:3709 stop:4377 length:669 start_codon:yes stop_codon:yes gene_type:complete